MKLYLTWLLSSLHLFITSYHQSRSRLAIRSTHIQHSIRSTSTSLRCAQMEHNVNTPSPHIPPLELLDIEVNDEQLICTEKLSSDDVERLVRERDFYRSSRDYSKADEIKLFLEQQYSVEITDVSYKQGGRSTWRYKLDRVGAIETNFMELAHMSYELTSGSNSSEASIHIANIAKDLLRLQYYSFVDDAADNIAVSATNNSHGDADSISITTNSITNSSVMKGRSTSTEMQGRKYADAAFEFSMSGITDSELFAMLADSAYSELMRFGSRPSCKPVNILHIVEKLAVAGVKDHPIFGLAHDILRARGVTEDVTRQLKPPNRYSLFSSRPLMWLWRYATKQKKPTNTSSYTTSYGSMQHNSSMSAYEEIVSELNSGISPLAEQLATKIEYPPFSALFTNCTLPLIIDLGCGYGVSLLSMCDRHALQATASARELNFLGIDLSGRAIRYANGISNRWGFNGKCAFQYGDCLSGLEWIRDHYAGPVVLVVINFPTPYHIRNVITSNQGDDSSSSDNIADNNDNAHSAVQGNAQLFDSLESFMCNAALFSSIARMFNKLSCPNIEPCLFLQSNVEDVAVTMRNAALSIDEHYVGTGPARFGLPEDLNHARGLMLNLFFHTPMEEEEEEEEGASEYTHQQQWVTSDQLCAATNSTAGGGRLSQRLQLWMDYLDRWGGDSAGLTSPSATLAAPYSRACGVGWLPESLLPYGARTETEAHCEFEVKPVHRMLFVYRSYYRH